MSEQLKAIEFSFAAIQMKSQNNKSLNLNNASFFIKQAAANGAQVVALPVRVFLATQLIIHNSKELFSCPYQASNFQLYAESIDERENQSSSSVQAMRSAARDNKIYLIGGSILEHDVGVDKYYNTSVVFNPDGEIIAKHRKLHLFDVDIPQKITMKESDFFSQGSTITTFDTPYCRFGLAVCYDLRFPELAQIMAVNMNAQMLVYPSAFNMTTGPLHWKLLLRTRAVDCEVFVAGISTATNNDTYYVSWGHSMIVNPKGQIMNRAGHEQSILYAQINMSALQKARQYIPVLDQKRSDLYELVVKN